VAKSITKLAMRLSMMMQSRRSPWPLLSEALVSEVLTSSPRSCNAPSEMLLIRCSVTSACQCCRNCHLAIPCMRQYSLER
jgi:hypothetical protein